jgi:hypothetical protein
MPRKKNGRNRVRFAGVVVEFGDGCIIFVRESFGVARLGRTRCAIGFEDRTILRSEKMPWCALKKHYLRCALCSLFEVLGTGKL